MTDYDIRLVEDQSGIDISVFDFSIDTAKFTTFESFLEGILTLLAKALSGSRILDLISKVKELGDL